MIRAGRQVLVLLALMMASAGAMRLGAGVVPPWPPLVNRPRPKPDR